MLLLRHWPMTGLVASATLGFTTQAFNSSHFFFLALAFFFLGATLRAASIRNGAHVSAWDHARMDQEKSQSRPGTRI